MSLERRRYRVVQRAHGLPPRLSVLEYRELCVEHLVRFRDGDGERDPISRRRYRFASGIERSQEIIDQSERLRRRPYELIDLRESDH